MNISVSLLDDYNVEIGQSDIEDMWNYLMDDHENFVYKVTSYLENLEFEYHEEELRPLYERLKKYYEKSDEGNINLF